MPYETYTHMNHQKKTKTNTKLCCPRRNRLIRLKVDFVNNVRPFNQTHLSLPPLETTACLVRLVVMFVKLE